MELDCPRTDVDFGPCGQVVGTFQDIIVVLRVSETVGRGTISSRLDGRARVEEREIF